MRPAPRTGAMRHGRKLLIGVPLAWLLVFLLLPFLLVVKISLSQMQGVRLTELIAWHDGALQVSLHLGSYAFLLQDALYLKAYVSSLEYAGVTTLLCLLLGYPFAYAMARARASVQPALLMLVMLPFWTSLLLRAYAWKGLLSEHGWAHALITGLGLDRVLVALGLIPGAGQLMNTPFSLVLGMTTTYLPFMVLPLYATLARMDTRLLEAAADLGATAWVAFWRVTVPLSRAGIVAGSMLVFIPCVGEFVVPELLGGPQTLMIGRVMWDEFFSNNDWPMASAVAVTMVLLVIVPLALFNRYKAAAREAAR
ncbi:MAG: ABC transporter permease subunit [Rhizobacter sp.]|nr:ABC transporter permease subunit [Rhizobacter sp.]